MFGTRWFATLYGFAFFSHQVGGFLGVWLGGIVFEATGSYNPVWYLSIFFGVASALINLPIVEKPVERGVQPSPPDNKSGSEAWEHSRRCGSTRPTRARPQRSPSSTKPN